MGPEVADLWVAGIWIRSNVFMLQMQLLRTTRGSMYVRLVCLYFSISFCMSPLAFCNLLKKSSGNTDLKICGPTQYFFADASLKKKSKKFNFTTALLGHPVQNIFFCFNQKIFLETLVEIIF